MVQVIATRGAAEFVQEHGGRVFFWSDDVGLGRTAFVAPDRLIDFERIACDGFELNVDRTVEPPRRAWYVVYHRVLRRLEVVRDEDSGAIAAAGP